MVAPFINEFSGERRMKARRVLVMLEIETDLPLALLRDRRGWGSHVVLQAQANVIRPTTTKRKARKKA